MYALKSARVSAVDAERRGVDTLLSRRSIAALGAPGPSDDALLLILKAAMRAPDHGRLKPWRFIIIRDGASAAFATLLVRSLKARDPSATDKRMAMLDAYYSKIPLIIGVVAQFRASDKIPQAEQLLSAGAAAMNILNAAHALGYGSIWLTGDSVYDPKVTAALGVNASDRLLGLLCIGTAEKPPLERPSPDLDDHVVYWTGK